MLLSLSCETDAAGAIIGSGPSQALVWSDLDISEQLCPVTLLGMTIFANIKLETTALGEALVSGISSDVWIEQHFARTR